MKPLILIGGGGHCKSVIEAAESAGYSILGILDKPEEVGKTVLSTKVIGIDDDIPQLVDKAEFMVTVGFIKNPSLRIALYERVKNAGGVMANVIACTAHVSRYAEMGGDFYTSQSNGQRRSRNWQQCHYQYFGGYRTRHCRGRSYPYINGGYRQWRKQDWQALLHW